MKLGGLARVAGLVLAAACVTPAWADECPALVRRIYDLAGARFDASAYDARERAAEAARLHTEDHHREARIVACQGLVLLAPPDINTPSFKKMCP